MATNRNDPQASLGLSKCMDVLKRIEIVWPSAGRAWELLNGAKEDLPELEIAFPSFDRVRKRSADDPLSLDDATFLNLSRSSAPANGNSAHVYPAAGLSHRYGPGPILDMSTGEVGTNEPTPLALFSTYNHWTPDSSLGFPSAALSTSVLPQQYSTGFVQDRHHHTHHASIRRHTTSSTAVAGGMNIGNNGPEPHERSPYGHEHGHGDHGQSSGTSGRSSLQYWSDFSMGPPASMLGSMYAMESVLSSHGDTARHEHEHPQHQQMGSGSGPGNGQQHAREVAPHSPHEYNGHPPFVGDHYNVFGH